MGVTGGSLRPQHQHVVGRDPTVGPAHQSGRSSTQRHPLGGRRRGQRRLHPAHHGGCETGLELGLGLGLRSRLRLGFICLSAGK